MWEVLHLVDVSDVLIMTAISMDQSLLLLNFPSLYVFEHIDIAFICGDQEVAIVYEDKYVENLLTIVHDVTEHRDQVASLILSLNLLILDERPH